MYHPTAFWIPWFLLLRIPCMWFFFLFRFSQCLCFYGMNAMGLGGDLFEFTYLEVIKSFLDVKFLVFNHMWGVFLSLSLSPFCDFHNAHAGWVPVHLCFPLCLTSFCHSDFIVSIALYSHLLIFSAACSDLLIF